MSRINRSLSTKLSLGILLMAAPVFILALGILFLQSRYLIRKEATERASSALRTTLQHVRNYMSTVETAVNANTWMIEEDLQPDSLIPISQRIVQLNRHVSACSIIMEPGLFPQHGRFISAYTSRNGDSLVCIRENNQDYTGKAWYKLPLTSGEACWVDPLNENTGSSQNLDQAIATYCKPLRTKEGRKVGVITADLSFQQLAHSINSIEHPYPNAYFMLIDGEGRYLIHPDTTRLFRRTIFTDADPSYQVSLITLGHEMTSGKQGNMRLTVDGGLRHVCYTPVPGTNWSLALVCPDNDILKSYHHLAHIIAVVIIVGLLIIVLLCHRSVANSIRPINRLLDMSQQIRSGNFDIQIPVTSRKDVIGRLQNSFAAMQQSINFHIGSIRYTVEETKKRNQELALATQQAEEAVRQKTIFIQNVSHQIRTPLNIISGFVQVLRDSMTMPERLPEAEAAEITSLMRYNASHLDRMVLMLFDSSDTGLNEEMKNLTSEEVECNKTAQECIDFTKRHFPNVHISLTSELSDKCTLRASHIYLLRTLRELLYNAAKYSDGQHITMHLAETDTTVRFIVEDKGPGISKETYENIFKPFAKVDDLSEGLGLGLPLSKRHAVNMGGDLTLDTDYHDGCRFIVELPK